MDVLNQCDIVVDVGAVYDPEKYDCLELFI